MIFRPLHDPESSTWSYLVADPATRQAVLVDPVLEQVERDRTLIRELELALVATLETHVHADHVTGAAALRGLLGSKVVVPKAGGARGADVAIEDRQLVPFGSLALEARATPGHTDGCTTYVLHPRRCAFTGDALLVRGCGRTDFQQGDARRLWRSVHEQILSLPADYVLYPGHDYQGRLVTTVAEERAHNPRLGGSRTVEEFVAIMAGLALPAPKRIDVAVPANLRVGADA